ncbi:MAG TPA: sulfite exporter TauE/SafE family protein [Coleofasciculaceae cyanobacterium]|jgi:hypothetical protein
MLTLFWGVAIGLVLGLLGGGGGMVAIPVLIYILHYPFRVAVGSSLALVLFGALPAILLYWRKKQIDLPTALIMGLGGALGSTLGSRLSAFVPREALLWLLLVLMALSAWNMLQSKSKAIMASPSSEQPNRNRWKLILAGFFVGILTGLVGVGGGFLLVPVLMLFGGYNPRVAIATSLLVIGVNAAFGTAGYLDIIPRSEPGFLWLVLGSVLGSAAGFLVSFRVSESHLKKGFGLLLIGLILLLVLFPPMG